MKDERIEQALNKIRSEMTIIILGAVAVSFLVKTLLFKLALQDCLTEYLIMILAPLYQFVRMHMMKISLYSEPGSKQSVKTLLIVAAAFLVLSAVSLWGKMKGPAVYDWHKPVIFLVIFLVLFVLIYFMTNKFNRQRSQSYEKEFADEDKL